MASNADLTRDLFEWGLDTWGRRVFLQSYIGAEEELPMFNITEQVTRGLLFLDRTTGPIELWINSPGGIVDDALAIHDVIRSLDNPVITVGHGLIASAATLLVACGTGTRYVTPHACFMHHEGIGGITPGNVLLQKIQIQERERREVEWANLMGRYTRPKKWGKFWLNITQTRPELYLDARGMIRHGIADEILSAANNIE